MFAVLYKYFIGGRALSRAVIIGLIQVYPTLLSAAEFEAVDKLRVGAYAVIQGSADVQGAGFSVGGSSFAVSYGKIGIGTAAPAALLEVSGAAQFGSGATKSTFTATGNLQVPYGVSAGTVTITDGGTSLQFVISGAMIKIVGFYGNILANIKA
ncbi:MAG: hypothetical protein A2X31_07020 [Elusimicrobia bacterium GWB2_63_22]|nr:MAG: hypothetical protein A2X31_07020 [Elusimicrobia bacterium GWB2_63_22]